MRASANPRRQRRSAARVEPKRGNVRKGGARRERPLPVGEQGESGRAARSPGKSLLERLREQLRRRESKGVRVGNRRRNFDGELGLAVEGGGSFDRMPGDEREWPRRLAGIGLRLGMVIGVAWGLLFVGQEVYEYATTSPRFEARHLIYEPTPHVDDQELRRLLALEPGRNILSLDLEQLSQRIVEHPWVAQATVTVNLPDTLAIEVVEHEAAAVVLAERFYLVDGEGVPFKQLERGERGQLPVVTGIDREQLRDPARRDEAIATIGRGLEVLRMYQSKQRPRLAEVHLADEGSVVLYTAESGTQLQLGRDEFAARLERWDALRAALGERADRLTVVHLDHESRPDRRDRVVARFASPADEAVLLAQATQADASASENPDPSAAEQHGEAAEPAASKPAAGKRNRIPRYE